MLMVEKSPFHVSFFPPHDTKGFRKDHMINFGRKQHTPTAQGVGTGERTHAHITPTTINNFD
jgi:hypothetical protein